MNKDTYQKAIDNIKSIEHLIDNTMSLSDMIELIENKIKESKDNEQII